jgi:lysine biosynthesis protein LysW
MTSKCPTCKSPLQLETPLEINQQVICSNCGLELDVVWLYPLELAKVIDYKPDPKRKKHIKKKGKFK